MRNNGLTSCWSFKYLRNKFLLYRNIFHLNTNQNAEFSNFSRLDVSIPNVYSFIYLMYILFMYKHILSPIF